MAAKLIYRLLGYNFLLSERKVVQKKEAEAQKKDANGQKKEASGPKKDTDSQKKEAGAS